MKNKYRLNASLGKDWTTHMSVLIKAIQCSKGTVAEVGAGPFSTPLLHWLCKEMKRQLVTYENDEMYYNYARAFQSPLHKIRRIENWDRMDFNTHWGLVFIDHHPNERRGVDVINFKDMADYIVMHDTNQDVKYGFDKAWEHFKYKYTWKECKPWVSVVSNFKDLSNFEV